MSLKNELGFVSTSLANLPSAITYYYDRLSELDVYVNSIETNGDQRIFTVLKESPVWMGRAYRWAAQLKTLEDRCDDAVAAAISNVVQNINKTSNRKLTTTELSMYADADANVVGLREIKSQVTWLKRHFDAFFETLKSLQYALRSMSDLRVNSLHHETIE